MSYSEQVQAATKAAALQAVAAKFDQIVQNQPVHARDRAAVLANAEANINLLADDDTKDIKVAFNGSIGLTNWNDPDNAGVSYVTINCNATHAERTPA